MEATAKSNAESPKANDIRLRVEVYDALAARKGLTSVTAQAKTHGISRPHMSLIRARRKGASFPLAMRMAADLGTTVDALFERVTA